MAPTPTPSIITSLHPKRADVSTTTARRSAFARPSLDDDGGDTSDDRGVSAPSLQVVPDSPLPDAPRPTSSASPGLIAHYLLQREVNGDYTLSRDDVIQECTWLGVDFLPVLEKLEGYGDGAETYSVGNITFAVDEGAYEQLRAAGKTPCCPVPRWVVGATSGRERYSFKDCESWYCLKHAPLKARECMQLGRSRFLNLAEVWYTEMADDAKHLGRLRKRRAPARGGGGALRVSRDDKRLRCFATRELTGRDEPNNWQRLCPEEALERLGQALALPGARRARWSDHGWPTGNSDKPLDDPRAQEAWIPLPGVGHARHDEVRQLAVEMAFARWGATPSKHGFPTDVVSASDWAETVQSADKIVRARSA